LKHPRQTLSTQQQRRVLAQAGNADAYGFFNLLTGPQLLADVEALLPEHRERLFPPTETLSIFLAQALSADGSCREAVNDTAVKRLVAGMEECSSNTAAYCKARARLPQTMVSTLALRTAETLAEGVADWWLWRGRRVRLADGATVTLADTAENQLEYPQPASQRKGLGFPMLRVVALMCLASGALLDAATGPCEGKGSDEQTLLRGLLDRLAHGDILLGDSFFPTYFLLCDLIRLLMAQAALLADQIPRQLSFKHTVQVWVSWQQRGGGTYDGVCIRPVPGWEKESCCEGRGRRHRRCRAVGRRGNEGRSVLRTHFRRKGLRSKNGRRGDPRNSRRLASGRGLRLERRILAQDDGGESTAGGVLTTTAHPSGNDRPVSVLRSRIEVGGHKTH
jgi:hypothetical protein